MRGWAKRGSVVPVLMVLVPTELFAAPPVATLPTGGQVTHGQAEISQSGAELLIRQGTEQLITNWESFSIGEAAAVRFAQPSQSSAALNRVVGERPSEIFGRLSANGQIILINPQGIAFGPNSRVDVAAFVASTLELADEDFLQGKLHFQGNAGGLITADGQLAAGDGSYIAFIAPLIEQRGSIEAAEGSVALAAGTDVELDLHGDGLVSLRVNEGAVDAVVENGGAIRAGNMVILTAERACINLLPLDVSKTLLQSNHVFLRALRDQKLLQK